MTGRIDADLSFLLDELELLSEYLPDFDDLDEGMQDVWLYDWPNDRAILEDLERRYRAGEMSAEQANNYRLLIAKLRELAPEIERVLEMRALPKLLHS